VQPELRVGRAWAWEGERIVPEPFLHLPAAVAPGEVQVLAVTADGAPLVTRHAVGAGSCYTCLVPWYEGANAAFAGPAIRLMDHTMALVQPVTVTGLPVEWMSTTGAEHRTVVIANHAERAWNGEVTVRRVPADARSCRELLTGETYASSYADGATRVRLTVPPYDLRAVRWEW
jgi:hypothetical protein